MLLSRRGVVHRRILLAVPASAGVETGTLADANCPAIELRRVARSIGAAHGDRGADQHATQSATAADQPTADRRVSRRAVTDPTPRLRQRRAEKRAGTRRARSGGPPAAAASDAVDRREPFGLDVLPVTGGDVLAKWNGVKADIRAENEILARCRGDAEPCPKAAQNFLAIVAQGRALTGRARIGVINRADQSGDRADERHGAMGRARPLERAARDLHDRPAATARIMPSPNTSR